MKKTSELAAFIHSELQQGKTIAQVKKDVKQRGYGWESKDISKAIHEAVQKELGQRKTKAAQVAEIKTPNAAETMQGLQPSTNQVWVWAVITAVLAVIVVTAVILYFVR